MPRMRNILKLIGFISATLILFVVVCGLAFYHLIRAGDVQRFLIAEIERGTELKARLDRPELEFGWIIGVGFRDFALTEGEAADPAVTAKRVTARVALLPLLRRQVVFYELRAQQPSVKLDRDEGGRFPLLDRLLNLTFWKQENAGLSLDLRSLRIEDAEITVVDHRRVKSLGQWRLTNADLAIERLPSQRLRPSMKDVSKPGEPSAGKGTLGFRITADLWRDSATMNLKAQGQLTLPDAARRFDEARWLGDVELVNVPGELMKDYLGAGLPIESASGYLAQRVHIEGSPATAMRLKGTVELRRLSLHAPELFLAPLVGLDGRTTFDIEWSRQRVRIKTAGFHAKELKFTVQGEISGIDAEDPHLRLNFAASPAPVVSVLQYLPLKIFDSRALERIVASVQSGRVEVKEARIDAPLSELSRLRDTGAKSIRLVAELRDVAANLDADGVLPLSAVHGRVSMADAVLAVENLSALYGDSRFSDVQARYHLSPAVLGRIEVKARGDVNFAELQQQMQSRQSPASARLLSSLHDLSGRGRIEIELERTPNTPLHFGGKLALDRVRLRYDKISLDNLQGEIAFTPGEIKGERLLAQLGGSPIQLRLVAKDYDSDRGVFDLQIESTGVRAGVISRLLLDTGSVQDPGIVRGSVRYAGSFIDKNQRRLTGQLDLLDVQLAVAPLLQPLRGLNGKINIDESGMDFVDLRALLAGVPAEASGRWRYSGEPQLLFEFAAPNLDITYLISQFDPESSEFYANLAAAGKITLRQGRIKNFDFTDLRTDVTIDRRVWRLTNLNAHSAGGTIQGVATIFDRPNTLGVHAEPKVRNVPMQSFLNWFGATTTEMTGKVILSGQLETAGRNDIERKQNLNGAFNLKIEDGTIKRMRILVQILNLLDLSRWFTLQLPDLTKEGIRFRAIIGDFKIVEGVCVTENLVVDSSDLRMSGAGRIDVTKDEVDFIVAVRPFAGIDSVIHHIPVLGRGLAAIKNSFLVASFNIKGKIDDPAITPAPLGTLSEMFWSVLGIPKNVVGLGEEEKKGEPAKRP
jgi:uncharacterized protein involved in outer membrane biogenesis